VKKQWDTSETKFKLLFNAKKKIQKYELHTHFPTYRLFWGGGGNDVSLRFLTLCC